MKAYKKAYAERDYERIAEYSRGCESAVHVDVAE